MARLIDSYLDTTRLVDGRWVIARGARGTGMRCLWWRVRDAWAVLRGRADAVTFVEDGPNDR